MNDILQETTFVKNIKKIMSYKYKKLSNFVDTTLNSCHSHNNCSYLTIILFLILLSHIESGDKNEKREGRE